MLFCCDALHDRLKHLAEVDFCDLRCDCLLADNDAQGASAMSTGKELAREAIEQACKEICAKAGTITAWPPNFGEVMLEHVARYGAQQRLEEAEWWTRYDKDDKEWQALAKQRVSKLEREAESLGATSAAKDGEK